LHTFNRRKKFQHQIDLFTDNEFSDKGIAIYIRRQNSIKRTRTRISYKKNIVQLIKELNQRLKEYDIKDTKLTVMQDTTDLKSDILSEINFNKSELSQKMFQF
jgi:hypothetical protein